MMNRIELITDRLYELHSNKRTVPKGNLNTVEYSPVDIINKSIPLNITEDMVFEGLNQEELVKRAKDLENVYNTSSNRYKKIQAAMFLSRIYNYYLPNQMKLINIGTIPYPAIKALENQYFDNALNILNNSSEKTDYLSEGMMKVLGLTYWSKAFNIIEEQVRVCFSNRYPELFKLSSLNDYRLINPQIYKDSVELVSMPVRIEHTSCVGSDIFYLAMDRPEKARCINISANLYDSAQGTMAPPISVIVRPIKEKGIRLTSIDLGCSKLVADLDDLFNMRNDDLSLLKAAVIVSGIVPPALKGRENELPLLEILRLFMKKNNSYEGFEIISRVIDIPRGSGLAVSTNLLAALIMALLRFSGQISSEASDVRDYEKMEVAARCIYGEWLGGSGGGWQDYGGMWGGFKIITGQPANSRFDPDSTGGLLPIYEEIDLPEHTVENILASLVLVNGGTGQDVGPVLRMITEQYVLRDKMAWKSRLSTEDRFDEIMKALVTGDVKMLGQLEGEDFIDRKIISPLSNNLYHEKTYERLHSIFKADLWGYDSTGGRSGAGGIFFIKPKRKREFEEMFLEVSREVQASLAGQMHFSSEPLVYRYEVNRKGASVKRFGRNKADEIIHGWLKARVTENTEPNDVKDQIDSIKSECTFNSSIFRELQQKYKSGQLSIRNNIRACPDKIKSIELKDHNSNIFTMPEIGTQNYNELFNRGLSYLSEPIAYIILNGGESTRYGVQTIRGLNPAFCMDGKYYSMIELKMRHLSFLHKKYHNDVYPVIVNSFFTNQNTKRVLKSNDYFGVPAENVFTCLHQVSHRVYPTVKDLVYWHGILREKGLTQNEEDLAKQNLEAMKEWIVEKGEGNIYEPSGRNKLYTLVSPGHYYSFMSIVTNYTLGFLLEKGVKRLIVSSNDNLLSTVDPAILAFHMERGYGTTAEVVPRLFDKGGAPVMLDDQVVILEDFSFPDQETLWKIPFFNPITTWMEIDSLLKILELHPNDLIEAAHGNTEKQLECNQAVERLASKLPAYVVLKHISEDMGNGITYEFPVIQFEKLYGDLVGLLNPMFLVVPKVLRHTQMKSVNHIYQIITDRALEVLRPQINAE